jgi:hypothetical protein
MMSNAILQRIAATSVNVLLPNEVQLCRQSSVTRSGRSSDQ